MTKILHETRSRTVLRYTREAVAAKALCVLAFSQAVAGSYLAAVQVEDRTLRFREDGDTVDSALKAQKHNWQLVDRLIKGASREFHCDLEEFWVNALPEPFRDNCQRELARRHGFAGSRPLADAASLVSDGLPGMAKEFGEVMAALAPILADGRVDEQDLPLVRNALQQGTDLVAVWLAIQAQLVAVLPVEQAHGVVVPMAQRSRA